MLAANKKGEKVPSLLTRPNNSREDNGFKSAAGEDSITRFDKQAKNKRKKPGRKNNGQYQQK